MSLTIGEDTHPPPGKYTASILRINASHQRWKSSVCLCNLNLSCQSLNFKTIPMSNSEVGLEPWGCALPESEALRAALQPCPAGGLDPAFHEKEGHPFQ